MKFELTKEELKKINTSIKIEFPKYTTQLMNLANQNAQGTRPKVVGTLSEIFQEYIDNNQNINIENWKKWYLENYPDAIDNAAEKIMENIKNLQEAIKLITKEMIYEWAEDLVINKTFNGLYIQKAILQKLAQIKKENYRLATKEEESHGIDGYVGNTAYSIKPITYKTNRLNEKINVKMIYYNKISEDSFDIEIED
ncbi:MjaI family restriction endonuclease [Brachyspira pilosicoli]|uniref:MjaI family restriction endonuclease n=1 Tax=Brachyspira pilosicoli TaxID=52584 RepID=UPI0030044690